MTDETLTDIDDIYASMLAQLEKEKAELLDALKNIMPFVYPLAYPGREAAVNAAKTAIENAEKTKQ